MGTPPLKSIGGMLIGYLLVCPRKAWLSMRGLWMEQESDTVAQGRLLDTTSYTRRHKHLTLEADGPDGTRLVGVVDSANLRAGVLHETKRGRSCEDAHRWQLRFYLWLLVRCGVTTTDGRPFTGQIDYPLLRRTERVTLEPSHEARLLVLVSTLTDLSQQPHPPARLSRRRFCRTCAFEELCYA